MQHPNLKLLKTRERTNHSPHPLQCVSLSLKAEDPTQTSNGSLAIEIWMGVSQTSTVEPGLSAKCFSSFRPTEEASWWLRVPN